MGLKKKGLKPTMPDIKITLSDEQQQMLTDEYKKACIEWLRSKPGTVPPPFEHWLAERALYGVRQSPVREHEIEELRTFNAIEELITRLQAHGFSLAHLEQRGAELGESADALAQAIVADLSLTRTRGKRIRELIEYYAKSPKEIADLGQVVVTNRAYGALHEAWRELVERTEKARDHLGEDKALGRVEGAVAILVGMNVMTRQAAREKTEAFRLHTPQ